jgi:hypothetical protein
VANFHSRGAYGLSGKGFLPIAEEFAQLVALLTSLHDLELPLLPHPPIDIASNTSSAAAWRVFMRLVYQNVKNRNSDLAGARAVLVCRISAD